LEGLFDLPTLSGDASQCFQDAFAMGAQVKQYAYSVASPMLRRTGKAFSQPHEAAWELRRRASIRIS
jgi:hypothetical protein